MKTPNEFAKPRAEKNIQAAPDATSHAFIPPSGGGAIVLSLVGVISELDAASLFNSCFLCKAS